MTKHKKVRRIAPKSYTKRNKFLYNRYGANPSMMSTMHRGQLPHTSLEKALRDISTSRANTTWVINYGSNRGVVNRNTM